MASNGLPDDLSQIPPPSGYGHFAVLEVLPLPTAFYSTFPKPTAKWTREGYWSEDGKELFNNHGIKIFP